MTYEALHPGPTSADVMRSIMHLHFPDVLDVVDLTFGRGTFWKGEGWPGRINITSNDLYAENVSHRQDWTNRTVWTDGRFQLAVFDPPFTANGPSKEGHQKRYGADRSQTGAPQNIRGVHHLLTAGIYEACRIASEGVIVKTQSVIESGKYHDSEHVAADAIRTAGWKIVDKVWFLKGRRPQPDAQRGSKVRHFRNRPSVFLIAAPLAHGAAGGTG